MANSTKQTTKKTVTRAVAKARKKSLVWAGAKLLIGKAKDAKAEQDRQLINMVAEVLEVSPFGINILGNQPYINNLGLKQKKEKYGPKTQFEYEWVQIAIDDKMKSVVKVRIVDKEGEALMPYIIAECSNQTMSMSTLYGYQNHMSQTRGENRAVKYLWGVKIHEDMLIEIGKRIERTSNEADKKLLSKVAGAVTVSAEEMPPATRPVENEEQRMYDLAVKRIGEIREDENALRKALGKISNMVLSDTQRQMVRAMIQGYLKELRSK